MVAVTGEVTSTEPIVRKSAVRSACEGWSRLVSTCVREIGSRKATARSRQQAQHRHLPLDARVRASQFYSAAVSCAEHVSRTRAASGESG
jgi:3-deoxy-D-manno-octulosonic-acid transferase